MDSVSETHEPEGGTSAAAALEWFVDPVLAVADGAITFANEAARHEFDLSEGTLPREPEPVLGSDWGPIEAALTETTVGTTRHVPLETAGYDVRVHRGEEGATIAFERLGEQEPPASDRTVKDRAINEAPVGITISDPSREDNPLVYINEAYEEITGYDYEDVVGRNCRILQGEASDPEAVAEMRTGIDEERPVTVELTNYRKDGTAFWNEVTIAPVRNDAGEVTHYVGFQNDVTARKEAELELERRTEELEHILERVEGLIQDVTDVVAGSTSRPELEAAVCERIAAEEAYEGAWIGERDPATEAIEIREQAGVSVEASSVGDDHPAAAALETGAVAVDSDRETTRASFPLRYNGIDYGVLTVCTDRDRAIDDRESVILSALARAVASGVNARETSRTLATDAVVAVEIELADPSVAPVALTAATDARLEYRRSVHRTGDGTSSLFTAEGATGEELRAAAAELPGVALEVLVEHEGSCLIELSDDADPVGWLSERGVRTRAIESEGGAARLDLEIPRSANVRSVVEAIEDRYDGTDVVSFRQRESEGRSRQEFASRLEESLTDRQFTALQRAYLAGYFEWPRPTTGEELAQTMGVSRPTFHEHLRGAEAKLCGAFFGEE
ncbi:bacterio-opsin activator domain-containing protein [Natronococcus jeotgali]|uniref:Bacterio-opsin activator n=1 Tax=Natronococcus jeotgali DSM 18795 TaxID=1227498 RepID=L9WMX9_9EURY|nr:bacterio-opsin activator domain-containing protein [Natronococcus jeotgali]ELY50840.1 bacterio-opsin activator [Natronococcus jeotgali DSM 18795]